VVLAFRAFQAALNSALAVLRSEAEPVGRRGHSDGDGPEPDARHALDDEADPADALPGFQNGIVIDAVRAELQHISRASPGSAVVAGFKSYRNSVPQLTARAKGRVGHEVSRMIHGSGLYRAVCDPREMRQTL
jgi:hypothetical protein